MAAIEDEDITTLVKRYAETAAAHGRATEAEDHKEANLAHEVVAASTGRCGVAV
jgi:hypothetical protein